jgi:flagellar basal-body rod modification protein FlgD
MIVSSSAETGAARQAAAAPAKADVGYDAFLKLLIASMKNQDPTQPNDPAQTLSQLASFSSVEQIMKLSDKLDGLLAVAGTGQAAGLIGKHVSQIDGEVSGVVTSVEVTSSGLSLILDSGKRIGAADGFRITGDE